MWLFAPRLPCPFSPFPLHLTHSSPLNQQPPVSGLHSTPPYQAVPVGMQAAGCWVVVQRQWWGWDLASTSVCPQRYGSDRSSGDASATTELLVRRVCFCPGQCCPSFGIVKPSEGLCLEIFACVKTKVPFWETALGIFPWFNVYPPNASMACSRAVFSI